jgi:hypothetical protein
MYNWKLLPGMIKIIVQLVFHARKHIWKGTWRHEIAENIDRFPAFLAYFG